MTSKIKDLERNLTNSVLFPDPDENPAGGPPVRSVTGSYTGYGTVPLNQQNVPRGLPIHPSDRSSLASDAFAYSFENAVDSKFECNTGRFGEGAPEQTACNGAGIGLFTSTGREKIHSAEC